MNELEERLQSLQEELNTRKERYQDRSAVSKEFCVLTLIVRRVISAAHMNFTFKIYFSFHFYDVAKTQIAKRSLKI